MEKIKKEGNVLVGNINQHLLRLALPSIGGMLAITIFNLTDTYFVSRLGEESLAAIGFTFPIVLIVGSISIGISTGAGSVVARAMGQGNRHLMRRVATDGILLAIVAVLIVSLLGYFTIDSLFTFLGATPETLPLVRDYMSIWYVGAVVVIMPPVSDACMRAMGNMVYPFIVMMVCAIFNFILDPILIFGYFGFPKMGMAGAALATVIARFLGMITTLSFLHFRYRMIDFKYKNIGELFESWNRILHVGISGAVIRIFPQIVRALMIKLAMNLIGVSAVAAIAAGTKVESFATIISMAVGVALVPIVGQNYGAGKYERVDNTRKLVNRIAIVYGLIIFLLIIPIAKPIGRIFTDDAEVIWLITIYLAIMFISTIGLNMYNWESEMLNVVGKPKWSMLINIIGTVVLLIPPMYVGAHLFGFIGMLVGLGSGQIVLGLVASYIGKRQLTN